jgi:hypothetical protein
MSNSTIKTVYIKGTGRSAVDVATSTTTSISGPGVAALRSPVFNWVQEVVCGFTTGELDTYTLKYKPSYPDTLSVFINGLLQRPITDYTLDEKKIIFTGIIPSGFNIMAKYNAIQMSY